MDDEGIGIAGWLFADLMLVLALVFVVVGRGDADDAEASLAKERAAHEETKDALSEARAAAAETLDALAEERAAHAETQGKLDEERASAEETQDALDEAHAVVAETQDALKKTRACLYELNPDFSFDQIVLRDVTRGSEVGRLILNGYVRKDIEKSQEGIKWTPPDSSRQGLLPFLWERQQEGSRIALVETYSRDRQSAHVALSREVNAALFATLASTFSPHTPIFTDLEIVQKDHTGAYLWEYPFEPGEVRINLFFVQPPGEDCEQR